MEIYKNRTQLNALTKAKLIDILLHYNCVLEIPEINILLTAQSVKNAIKKCQCCSETCCVKYPLTK